MWENSELRITTLIENMPDEEGKLVVDDCLLTPEQVRSQMLAKIEEIRAFSDVGEGTVTIDETEDIDWINNWKQYFHQFWIDDVLVIPSWEKPEPVMENGRLCGMVSLADLARREESSMEAGDALTEISSNLSRG